MPHLHDEDLVRWLDGEVDAADACRVREHLQACPACRERFERLRDASAEVAALVAIPAPATASATAALRRKLAQRDARLWPPLGTVARVAAAAAVALLAPLWILWPTAAGPLPDARLTPGATLTANRDHVCRLPAEDEGRLVSPALARQVFAQYRIQRPQPRAYEVDYLISPALGGSGEIRNLWPVPYTSGVWTSRVKDALEDHLRTMVCAGQLDLATAQSEIARDWIAAYRKYFRTREPLAAHAYFDKDSPWE